MRKGFGNFILMTGFIFMVTCAPSIMAQEADEGEYEFTLEEITVTAQKREENQQKVPIAMDIITSDDLQGAGKYDLDEVLANVSSVLVQRASDGLRVSIRGMYDNSQARSGQSQGTPSVAINTDGVYSNRKDSAAGLYDIERVEVLYGPQSTMYSSNSPGGIVNIITASPKLDNFSASASVEYGSYNLLRTEGAMNAPLGDKTAVRVSFSTLKRDSYMSNLEDVTAEDSKSARIRALYQPNDSLSVTVNAERTKTGGTGFGGGVNAFIDQDDEDDPWTSTSVNENLGSNDHTADKFSANINLETDWGTVAFIPSYSTRTGDNLNTMSNSDPVTGETTTSSNYQTQLAREKGTELRITSPSDFFFKWIAGGNYYKSKDNQTRASEDYVEDPTTGYWTSTTMKEKSHAFFANVTYPVLDRFRLTAGYRQSWDLLSSDDTTVQNATGSTAQQGPDAQAGTTITHSSMENNGKPDFKYGFEYDLAENSMVYGDYSTSYRVANMPGSDTANEDPEKLKAYTLGAKNRFWENKLQLNIATYYYDYKNFAVTDSVETTIGDEIYRENASDLANGYMYGLDLETSAILTQKDTLNLSVSYIKSQWDELCFDYDYADDVNYHGVPMAQTPPWTWNLTYSHNFLLSNGSLLKAGITSKYQTGYRMTWSDIDLPYSYQEGHHMENFNLSYNSPGGRWTVSGYVNNIFNYAEKTMVQSAQKAGSIGTMSIGNPRTYAVSVSYRY